MLAGGSPSLGRAGREGKIVGLIPGNRADCRLSGPEPRTGGDALLERTAGPLQRSGLSPSLDTGSSEAAIGHYS